MFTNVMGFTGLIYMLRYATTKLGFTRSTILTFTIIANVIEVPATLYFAHLSDRVGRRTVYLFALGFAMIWGLAFFRWSTRRSRRCICCDPRRAAMYRRDLRSAGGTVQRTVRHQNPVQRHFNRVFDQQHYRCADARTLGVDRCLDDQRDLCLNILRRR